MKKKFVLTGFLGFTFLFGCNQIEGEVKAGLPSSFEIVSEDEIDSNSAYKIKDEVTGCFYILTSPQHGTSATANVTQMFVEKDGVSVPYCEK